MEIKKRLKSKLAVPKTEVPGRPQLFLRYACIFTAYILLPHIALTQSLDYFFETTGDNPRIVQRLSWKSDDSVFNYELQIDKEENNAYRTILREKTARSFFNVSLDPGKYRYRVTPFDYLEKPGAASEWKYIEIIRALKPVLYDAGAEISHDDGEYAITVFGENIAVNAQIYLLGSDERKLYPDNIIIPKDDAYIQLFFSDEILAEGEYSIFIINPGGYETGKSGIFIEQIISEELLASETTEEDDEILAEESFKTEDPVEDTETEDMPKKITFIKPAAFLNVSVGWVPIIPIYSGPENNKLIDRGITIRFAVVSERRKPLDFGFEYASGWYARNKIKNYDIAIDINLLARKWLANNHIAIAFRTGMGMIMLSGNEETTQSEDILHTNVGISFLFLLFKHLFFEVSAEHVHLFTEPAVGVLRPCFSVGLQY